MLSEVTSKIKLKTRYGPISVQEALHQPRLVRKQLEVPLLLKEEGPLLVGRDENMVNLVISDSYISRTHAAIFKEGGRFFLQDLNSKNGTYLNGKKLDSGQISDRPLQNGDRIGFNVVEFIFVVPEGS
jgi:pSer/pThr/pTyr-binding forkhead associated (FHA) protein